MNPEAKILLEQAEKLEARADQLEAEAAQRAGDLRSGKLKALPMDALPPEIGQALKRAWDKLPESKKQQLREQARQALERLEDKLNEEIKIKLEEDAPLNHEEMQEAEQKAAEAIIIKARTKAARQAEEAERIKAAEAIARELAKGVSEYDKAYADVKAMIDKLADELRRIFQPTRHPRWRSGFPTGERMNLHKAMQYEADPAKYAELMDRKSVPQKHDFRFTLLVDLSGSMGGAGKIENTFRGAILLAEALENVGVKFEILGFQDEVIVFKKFDEPMGNKIRGRMSGMPLEVSDKNPGGHNNCNYNDDGYAVKTAADRLAEQEGREKFLVVLSDGSPVPSMKHDGDEWELAYIVNKIREGRAVKMVGVGLGPDTEHVRDYYPNSTVMEKIEELPQNLAGLFEDMVRNPDTY